MTDFSIHNIHSNSLYREAEAYIDGIPKFAKKTGPENTRELLRRLGNPDRNMKILHAAGTNGKGSVCAFISAMLIRAGKRTGLFTSPHLVEMTERIRVNGENISEEAFSEAFLKVRGIVEDMIADGFAHPAYFEFLFGMGMYLFEKENVEYLVLETGLGGRLDATNQVSRPLVSILTSISMDHMQYLGNTLEEIAAEKAGIIKNGVPVVCDGRSLSARQVILKKAEEKNAPVTVFTEDMVQILDKTDKSIDFILNSSYDNRIKITVASPAEYQVYNSSLAYLAIRVIDPDAQMISDADAADAIRNTVWEGRMETILPGVILDGAHNEDGVRELVRTAERIAAHHSVSLLFSAVADKEYEKMIRLLCERIRYTHITVTQIQGTRCVSSEVLKEVFEHCTDTPVKAFEEPEQAFAEALACREDSILFCAGSLYLAGVLKAVLKKYQEEQKC